MGSLAPTLSPTVRTVVATPKVGFFGCPVIDGIVRVTTLEPRRSYPRVVRLEACPGCGGQHGKVHITWRVATEFDTGKEATVVCV